MNMCSSPHLRSKKMKPLEPNLVMLTIYAAQPNSLVLKSSRGDWSQTMNSTSLPNPAWQTRLGPYHPQFFTHAPTFQVISQDDECDQANI